MSSYYDQNEIDRITWLQNEDNSGLKLFEEPLEDGTVEIIDWTKVTAPSNLDKMKSGSIIGREQEMISVIKLILDSRVKYINIIGEEGIGKTRFVKELAKHIMQRHFIKDGVFYLDFKNVQN